MNLRDHIQQARDVDVMPVEVPEWGCTVYLRQLSVRDRMQLFDRVNNDNTAKLSVYVLLACLCDEGGQLVFGPDDYDVIASKSARVVDRLGKLAAEHNRMNADAVDEAKKN